MNKENNKEAEIKESFHKTLSMYPIKNLEDLYDKEGYRDEEFEKRDKGTWIINSVMNIQKKGQAMESRGMVAKKMNRQYIGIEINRDYCQLAKKRIEEGR